MQRLHLATQISVPKFNSVQDQIIFFRMGTAAAAEKNLLN